MSGPVLLPNFGAEEGEGRTPPAAAARLRPIAILWSHLFGAGARILGEADPPPWPAALGSRPEEAAFPWLEALEGVAWLSTRRAWEGLRGAGVLPDLPSPDVVAKVHDKAFAQGVAEGRGLHPPCLRGLIQVLSSEDLEAGGALERIERWAARLPPWVGGAWTLKPRLGSSGRGRIGGKAGGATSPRRRLGPGALRRLARRGGAICEPWLERRRDLSTQLHIGADGAVELLGTTRQLLSPQGIYLGNAGLLDPGGGTASGSDFDPALRRAGLELGEAAAAAGFWGPCGIDAFSFRGPEGETTLRPVVELNARFTMGTIALGVLARARAAGLLEGMRSFRFLLAERPDPAAPGLRRIALGDGAALHLAPDEALATAAP